VLHAPARNRSDAMIKISEKYRLKAIACEKLAKAASDDETKFAWMDIAIEWHALASRTAMESVSVAS
jgi:hypothetical protein